MKFVAPEAEFEEILALAVTLLLVATSSWEFGCRPTLFAISLLLQFHYYCFGNYCYFTILCIMPMKTLLQWSKKLSKSRFELFLFHVRKLFLTDFNLQACLLLLVAYMDDIISMLIRLILSGNFSAFGDFLVLWCKHVLECDPAWGYWQTVANQWYKSVPS